METSSPVLAYVFVVAYIVALIIAAGSDLAKFEIPNTISVGLVVLFVLSGLILPPEIDWLGHLVAGVVVFTGAAILFYFRVFGGGDAKLLAACALWVGLDDLIPFLFIVSVLGAVLAIALLALRHGLKRVRAAKAPTRSACLPRLLTPGESLPYGVAISSGALLFLPKLPVFSDLAASFGAI